MQVGAHRACRAKPGIDAVQDTLAQAAVLWLRDVPGQLRDLLKQWVLRQVAHCPRSFLRWGS